MEIDVAGMKAVLETKTMTVRVYSPEGTGWQKQGVAEVLLFGILVALANREPKRK